jgi:hypothetical protein
MARTHSLDDLIAACHPMGIKVLEHLIVTDDACFSFADSGLLDELALVAGATTPLNGANKI